MKQNHRMSTIGLVLLGASSCWTGVEARGRLPSCDDFGRIDAVVGDSVTTTCEIRLTGLDEGARFKVELVSGKVAEEGLLGDDAMVRVTKMWGDDPQQIIEEAPVTLLVPPGYKDVNGDGEADLLVTLDQGNVNSVSAVWLGSPDGAPYYRAGEIGGFIDAPTADGYITAISRGSANSQCIAFYRLVEQELGLVASVCVTALDDAATKTTCELDDVSGLAAVKLSKAAAKAKFCAEPTVVNVYQ